MSSSHGAAPGPVLPKDYPSYFDGGFLKTEYVTTIAENIAKELELERLAKNQLRDFYDYVKKRATALKNEAPEKKILAEVAKLKAIAYRQHQRRYIGEFFKKFLDANIDKVTGDGHAFLHGFVEHFEAVVGFCEGRLRERQR